VKIRYVLNNAYGTGGTIRSVFNQANALCADHDVEIASVYRHRDAPAFPLDPRVRLIPLTDLLGDGTRRTDSPGQKSRLANKTRRFKNRFPHRHDARYRRWDPVVDATVIRYFWAAKDGVLITTRPGLNLLSAWYGPRRLIRIAQDHMNLATYKPPLRAEILRGYPRLDAVTVLTEHDLATYREATGGRVRLERVPNGIPPARMPPAALENKVLIAAGRLSLQKGFDMLVEAFGLIAERYPDWQLRIFGWGDEKAKLVTRIGELGIGDQVRLMGATRNLDEELASASAYVLSSRFEGLPMVLLEALTVGLPAVAFDCPTGPAEIIKDGVNGLLIPSEDVPALAEGMARMIDNPDERRAMGKAALASSDRYTIGTVKATWEKLFADLADARLKR
jgi:glycosyltransferase involved in cell wall biosynthesis